MKSVDWMRVIVLSMDWFASVSNIMRMILLDVNLKMYGLSFVILGMLLLSACSSPTSTTAPTQAQVPLQDPSLQTGSLSSGDQKGGSSFQGPLK